MRELNIKVNIISEGAAMVSIFNACRGLPSGKGEVAINEFVVRFTCLNSTERFANMSRRGISIATAIVDEYDN